jgi:DNA-binding NarL/FixJ family response regulator
MPVLSGFDALPRLRQAVGAAKIIVLSGLSAATAADQVLALGADSYLEKGADPETIVAAIEQVVADTVSSTGTASSRRSGTMVAGFESKG